ncbi:MAG: flagellar filament capping protein FliD, partial [Candidatus Tectomicrobia bacterium]|nr:flagellar filament capping protein FliD [Candidatus Tectomicrobia bacterium]
ATLSAAASKVFLSYQHGGLLFTESQAVRDAIIKLGAGDSTTTVTKNSNTVTDLIEGVTLTLTKADPAAAVTVDITRSTQGVNGAVNSLVKAINDTEALIEKNTFFDSNTNETGALFSDSNLFIVRSRVSAILTGVVESVPAGKLRALREVGISLSPDTGRFIFDSSKLSSLLSEKPDEVRNLFASVALPSDGDIKALTFTDKTKTSTSAGYDLQITQAGTRATDEGKQNVSAGLTQNETLTITVGAAAATVSLTNGMTAEQAASAINSALQGAVITNVRAVFNSTTGKISILHDSFGSKFSFTVKSSLANGTAGGTGLGGPAADTDVLFIGRDVAGTINGEAATGEGQTLTGNTGNASTEGLQLLVELTPDQLAEQGSSQGTVSVSRGVASRLEELLAFLTDTSQDGPIQGAIEEANERVEDLQSQIDSVNARIERERLRLSEQFARLEQALGTLQTTSAFLSRQLAQISANSASLASSPRR